MKATYQWNSAGKSCLSKMPILRATEVNEVSPNLRLRDHLSRKFPFGR
jgi:hypothetical protein